MAQTKRLAGSAGTGHINFSDWSAANAAGANRLVDSLAGNVNAQGQAASEALDGLNDDFWERVRGGTLRYDDEGLTSQRAGSNAHQGYMGPTMLADVPGYAEAFDKVERAHEGAQQAGNLYGRAVQLGDMYGRGGDYSNGQRLLDSALAGNAGAGRFGQLQQQWGGLLGRAQGMERDASATAQEARRISEESARRYAEAAPRLAGEERGARDAANDAYLRDSEFRMDAAEREQEEAARRRRAGRTSAPPTSDASPGRKGPSDKFFVGW